MNGREIQRRTRTRPRAQADTARQTRHWRTEDSVVMRHFSCDICGKNLTGSETRYVVRMETFAIEERPQLTDADLEQDHIEAMAEMLAELEEAGDITETVPAQGKREFDLCPACHRKFSADPLGREPARKLHFSKN